MDHGRLLCARTEPLEERPHTFTVSGILDTEQTGWRELMPNFPASWIAIIYVIGIPASISIPVGCAIKMRITGNNTAARPRPSLLWKPARSCGPIATAKRPPCGFGLMRPTALRSRRRCARNSIRHKSGCASAMSAPKRSPAIPPMILAACSLA